MVHYYCENAAPYTEYLSIVDKTGSILDSFYEVGATCSAISFADEDGRLILKYDCRYKGELVERVRVDITEACEIGAVCGGL